MTTPNPEQELMQKIATILHEDDQQHLSQTMILDDGLGAHVPESTKIAAVEPQPDLTPEPTPVEEPKTALAGMSVAQIMHQPAFQEGVEARMVVRTPELMEAVIKVANAFARAAARATKPAAKAASKGATLYIERGKGLRGLIRDKPLRALGGGLAVGGGTVAAFKSGRKEA